MYLPYKLAGVILYFTLISVKSVMQCTHLADIIMMLR